MQEIDPDDVATKLACLANSYSARANIEPIVSYLMSEHPTLQQAIAGHLILNIVKRMASMYVAGSYDLRNEAACRICHTMWEHAKDDPAISSNGSWVRLPLA